jgi:YHS domain-containing protein
MTSWMRSTGILVIVGTISALVVRADEPVSPKSVAKEQLGKLNAVVGGWRGVGQPIRGSNKGAWTETAEWVWDLSKDKVALKYVVTEGKGITSASLGWDAAAGKYVLVATLPDGGAREYRGMWEKERLVLESAADDAGAVHQVVVTPLNEKRMLVFLGTKGAGRDTFARVAEIGYTRAGTKLAVEGAGQPECIVTGGTGTSTVMYKGKTYYVCCTGCRDAFNDDPEGVLAEAAEREAKKKGK